MSAWISVKDRLPTRESNLLAYYHPRLVTTVYYDGDWYPDRDDARGEPTHWQPLPEPPEDT